MIALKVIRGLLVALVVVFAVVIFFGLSLAFCDLAYEVVFDKPSGLPAVRAMGGVLAAVIGCMICGSLIVGLSVAIDG